MPRPRALFNDAHIDPAVLFDAFRAEDPKYLKALFGDELGRPLHLVSDAIRGFVWAAPGHDLIAADYSSIQGAIAAWLSGEQWKLDAMFEIIADPSLPDMYRRSAAKIMGLSTEIITKKHPLRSSLGKVSELSLQFQGGVSAFDSMAKNYNINLQTLYEPVWSTADAEMREKVTKRYEICLVSKDKQKADVLSREAWLACDIIKYGWRAANPKIAAAWGLLEAAMRDAIRNPGQSFVALGKITYLFTRGFLWCRLPSGRCIAYASPRLKDQVWAILQNEDGSWPESAEVISRDQAEYLKNAGKAKIQGVTSPSITALGVNSTTQKMERYAVYGGLAMENCCLAIERDLLVRGMRNVEAAGYPVVLHVYDEAVAEVPRDFGSLDEFVELMCQQDVWTAGLPISASGWRGKRYRKD
jgi:DNA polymerase